MKIQKPKRKKLDTNLLKTNRKLKNGNAFSNLCPVCSSKLQIDTEGYWSCIQQKCYFTSRNVNAMNQVSTTIPDPMVVKRLERSLKRKLTEEELAGENKLWVVGSDYFNKEVKGSVEVTIPMIQFPDDL